jgi:hypothetical protein
MSSLTLDRLKAWLADEDNIHNKHDYDNDAMRNVITNGMHFTCLRKRFVTKNGYSISIQQSGTHYCNNENEVEMWHCPPSPLLVNYGDGSDPYAYVPLEVVAGYIDSLESLPPPEEPQ